MNATNAVVITQAAQTVRAYQMAMHMKMIAVPVMRMHQMTVLWVRICLTGKIAQVAMKLQLH